MIHAAIEAIILLAAISFIVFMLAPHESRELEMIGAMPTRRNLRVRKPPVLPAADA